MLFYSLGQMLKIGVDKLASRLHHLTITWFSFGSDTFYMLARNPPVTLSAAEKHIYPLVSWFGKVAQIDAYKKDKVGVISQN